MSRFIQRLLRTQADLSESESEQAIRWLIVDGACSLPMVMLQGGPLLVAYAVALGGSTWQVGLITTIIHTSHLMQLVGLYLVKLIARRRAIAVLGAGTSRLLWVPILLMPFVPGLQAPLATPVLLALFFMSALFGATPMAAWNSWYKDLVPTGRFGRITGTRWMLGVGLAVVLTLAAGQGVTHWENAAPDTALYAYSIVFGVFVLLGMTGVYAIYRLPERTLVKQPMPSLWNLLTPPFRDPNFRRLLAFCSTWHFAAHLATAFFTYYILKRIGLSTSDATILWTVQQVGSIFTFRFWGRVIDRTSCKRVFAICGPILLLCFALWPVAPMLSSATAVWVLLIVIHGTAGVTLAYGTFAFKLAPRESADTYMTVFGLVGAVAAGAAPLLAGWLFKKPESIPNLDGVFIAAAVLGGGALLLLKRVQEPAPATGDPSGVSS